MSNMKHIRVSLGLTQAILAGDVELTQSAIAHYENGRRSPGLDECRRIVRALNSYGARVTLDDVFPPVAPLTVNQTILPNSTVHQSSDGAVIPSSASGVAQ